LARPASIVTAHSLKTKYTLTALAFGIVFALLLAAALIYQYRGEMSRLSASSLTTLEGQLESNLNQVARQTAREFAERIAGPLAGHDLQAVQSDAAALLERPDIESVEVSDAQGTVIFAQSDSGPVAVEAPAPPALEVSAVVHTAQDDARLPNVRLGNVVLRLSRVQEAQTVASLKQQLRHTQQESYAALAYTALLACLVLIFASLVVAWFMARRVERPISALIKNADRIGQGDYTRPFAGVRKDELGELQEALERMRQKLRQTTITKNYLNIVLNSMNDAVLVTSPDGTIKGINDAARKLLGYSEEDILGKSILHIIAESERDSFSIDQAAQETRETVVTTRSGQTIPVSFSGSQITTEDPQFQGNIFVARNITERKRAERRIRYLARYDALTKVPNRMQFQHLLQQSIARSRRQDRVTALLYLDMDRFKEVNDTFGHDAGDRVLEVLTERLTRTLPKETVLGRLAGDEFALFLESLPSDADNRGPVAHLARQLLAEIGKAFYVQQQEVFLTASVGVAFCPHDAENVIDLIRNADAAMYYSKQNGGNSFAFYSPEMNAAAVERLMLKSKLRRALEREELVILYQPKVDLRDGTIVGAEALLRWRLPGHGDIPPSQFIPLAEENNLILDIGEWVLNRVCSDYRKWQKNVANPGRVSINLSLRQLRQATFITRFSSVFAKHEVSPTCFELEITETTLMADTKRTVKLLDELYAMGLHLSIDDFGTGYSSLSALQQFPIGTLKIDQSFVRNAAVDANDATIVKTIIDMGRSLNMEVVAEGVESEQQLAFLRAHRCGFGQGRLFGDAMTPEELLALLAEQRTGQRRLEKLFA
jgi:diguanylate cyclase (GGDEF)-like protein/PAS domain S-box-containing protein